VPYHRNRSRRNRQSKLDRRSSFEILASRWMLAGDLDSTFGGDGIVTTEFFNGVNYYDFASDVAVQPDQKAIILARDGMLRLSDSGSLDSSFGNSGKVASVITYQNALALQSDGKILVAGQQNGASAYGFGIARFLTSGAIDSSFGNDGLVFTQIGTGSGATDMVVQLDGKIVVSGTSQVDGNEQIGVARYNSNGSLDSSFGSGGKVLIESPGATGFSNLISLQADGKIVIGGSILGSGNKDILVVRMNANGSLDNTFDGDGKVQTDIGLSEGVNAIAIQSDGKILVTGSTIDFSLAQHVAVVRYNLDGSLDSSFDGDGVLLTDAGGTRDDSMGIAALPSGRIAVFGNSNSTNPQSIFVAQLNSNGSRDTNYDGDGIAIVSLPTIDHSAKGFAILVDGRPLIVGTKSTIGSFTDPTELVAVRLTASGLLDPTFDNDGVVITKLNISYDWSQGLTQQVDGKLVAVGTAYNGSTSNFAVARYNVDGSLDNTFGNSGTVVTSFGTQGDEAQDVAIQNDGKIVVAGRSAYHIALARYLPDGSLDSSFDGDGRVTTTVNVFFDDAYAVLVQADGKIMIAGSLGGQPDFILIRYNSDGSLDTSFSGEGILQDPVLSLGSIASDFVQQSDGKIVITGGSDGKMTTVRLNPDGSRDSTFGSAGLVVTPVGIFNSYATGIALQLDGKIVVGGQYKNANFNLDLVVVRYNSNGTLDSSFGVQGIVTTAVGSLEDTANSVRIQTDGKIVLCGTSQVVEGFDFAVIRLLPNGSLDGSFDGDGIRTVSVGIFEEMASDMLIQADGKIVAAGRSAGDFALIRLTANSAPVPANDTASTDEGVPVVISVLPNDSDPDNDPLSVVSATGPTTVNGNGTITYSPPANFFGSDTFTYTVRDVTGNLATATVVVTVRQGNQTGAKLSNGILKIIGTEMNDFVTVRRLGQDALVVEANFVPGGKIEFSLASVSMIVAHLRGGNDSMSYSGNIDIPSIIEGGSGNDNLGGSNARDLIIGGLGSDKIYGRQDDDILISGTTTYDSNDVALIALLREWNENPSRSSAIQNISNGSGALLVLGGYKLKKGTTVFDDGSRDVMVGGGGNDWLFFSDSEDKRED
jgi:uncharacterized delta-60 repeat protein